jgi:hypothetical protein
MRLGIVGAGEVGWRHSAAAAEVDGLTLTSVADRDVDRGRRLAERYGARAVADLDALLAVVDLVVLAVPHAYHADLAVPGTPLDRLRPPGPARPVRGRPIGRRGHRHARRRAQHRPGVLAARRTARGGARSIAVPAGWAVETDAAATLYFADGPRAHLTLLDSPHFVHETTIVCERGRLSIAASGLTVAGRQVLQVDEDREYTASFRRQYEALLRGQPAATLDEGRQAVAAVCALYRSGCGYSQRYDDSIAAACPAGGRRLDRGQ